MKMRWTIGALAVVAALLLIAGYRNATAAPVVTRYRVPVESLTTPLRIIQLTDIHLSQPDMPITRLQHIVAQVAALQPDLVVLTGDYLGGKLFDPKGTGNMNTAMEPFLRLHPRLGIFAVRGNHDAAYWARIIIPRYGITYLDNSWADAGAVVIAGVDDFITGRPDAVPALRGIPPGKPVLMLMHNPDAWPSVPPSVALSLAGHTHGGQIVLPLIGAPFTGSRYGQRFRYGLITEAGRRLIVSSGLGTTAIPLRFGTTPEIVEVTLVPSLAGG